MIINDEIVMYRIEAIAASLIHIGLLRIEHEVSVHTQRLICATAIHKHNASANML